MRRKEITNWIVIERELDARAPLFDESEYPVKIDANKPDSYLYKLYSKEYVENYAEGFRIYIVRDCYDPRRYRKEGLVLTQGVELTPFYPLFSLERVEMWSTIRSIIDIVINRVLNERIIGINSDVEDNKNWGVINLTVQTVCDDCFRVISKDKVITIEDNSEYVSRKNLCEFCYNVIENDKDFRKNKQGVVYFVQGDSYVKIGASKDVEKRISALQIASSTKLVKIHQILSNDHYATEREFHKHFRGKKIRGEFFNLSLEDIMWIKEGKYTEAIQRTIDGPFRLIT